MLVGLGRSRDELLWMRERWAQVANESLREAGLSTRLDHRSYKALGIDREPQPSDASKHFLCRAPLGYDHAGGR